jgi:hypothetical protein
MALVIANLSFGLERFILVPHDAAEGDGVGNPPNAIEWTVKFENKNAIARPTAVSLIQNSGANGDGKVEEGNDLCGSKWNGAAYVQDADWHTTANNRTYVAKNVMFVKQENGGKARMATVFYMKDSDAVPTTDVDMTNGPLTAFLYQQDNDTNVTGEDTCRVGNRYYYKYKVTE